MLAHGDRAAGQRLDRFAETAILDMADKRNRVAADRIAAALSATPDILLRIDREAIDAATTGTRSDLFTSRGGRAAKAVARRERGNVDGPRLVDDLLRNAGGIVHDGTRAGS